MEHIEAGSTSRGIGEVSDYKTLAKANIQRRKLNSVEPASLYEQALNAERHGKYAEAYELFHQCLSMSEFDRGDVSFHLGWCLEQSTTADVNVVLEFYRRAAQTAAAPECRINGWFRAGWVLIHQKEYAEAAVMFKEAIECGERANVRNEPYCHAGYWYAVCLESERKYLDAVQWYRYVQNLAPLLEPEAKLREVYCLNNVGRYEEALGVCLSIEGCAPEGFSPGRYAEILAIARREQEALQSCLSVDYTPLSLVKNHVAG